jgi:predicted extracellular nuclease
MAGQTVTVEGIVTYKIGSRNVYIQDVNGDVNDATSDAILVFGTTSDSSSVAIGDLVSVTGVVVEFIPGGARTRNQPTTEIVNPIYTIIDQGRALPAPVEIGVGQRLPPTSSLAESIVFWESLESMLVKVLDPVAVSGTTRFSETFVRTGGQVTSVSERGTLNIGPGDFNPERIQIQGDGAKVDVDVGATLEDVEGVVSYNFGEYEVVGAYNVKTPSTLAPTVTSLKNSESSVLIGSYNVLNLEVVNDLSTGRFALIAQHIVTNMGAPDIVGLQEVQDDDGAKGGTGSTITSAELTLQTIINEINKISSNFDYQFIDNTFIGDDTNGGQPGGNIRTAFLYNAKRVSYDEASLNSVVEPTDQQGNSANPFFNSRLPLAATFSFKGQTIEVVNVHFASKGGSAPLTSSDAQPVEFRQSDADVNGSVDQRFAMSQVIREYVSGKDNVVVLGDFNEFEFNLPMVNLLDTPLTNLAFTVPADERYSFIFNGNSQALDHIFVSPALDDFAQLEYIHVNVEFADTPQRASDHDPLVASIRIAGITSQSVCENFAVHARTTVTFAGVVTTLHGGDVGVSPGTSVTGAYAINGGELVADSSDFDASVQVAYAAAMAVRSDEQAIAIEIGGKTFTPGTYRSGSAINFAYGTVVVLDGLGQANPVFLFQAGTTLVTAADTYFILKNGAKAENVLWALGTAATLGANSVLEGSILAGTAITFGTQSELHGCALAQSAVTFESEGSVELNHYNADGQGNAKPGSARHLRG